MASNGWIKFKGKDVKVVFDDGRQIAIKKGILLNATREYILIKSRDTDEIKTCDYCKYKFRIYKKHIINIKII